jgi:hypothetical protein
LVVASLWGDGWFYISALGFLGSGALFLYLLGQYRSAVEDAEESDGSAAPPASPVIEPLLPKPVLVELTPAPAAAPLVSPPKVKAAPVVALPVAAPQPEAAPAPKPAAAVAAPGYTGPERRRSEATSSGGLSPAVVYLQNIKSQMERFDKEIAALKNLSAQQSAQGELLLKRLAELAEGLKTGVSPRSPLPAPTRSVELSLEPTQEVAVPQAVPVELRPAAPVAAAPAVPKPAPVIPVEQKAAAAPAEEPAAKSDSAATVVIEALPQETASVPQAAPAPTPAPQPEPAPVPPAQEQSVQPSQTRKGPVWPV